MMMVPDGIFKKNATTDDQVEAIQSKVMNDRHDCKHHRLLCPKSLGLANSPVLFLPGLKLCFFTANMAKRLICQLRSISGIVQAHHSCSGKQGKLSGSRLSTISKFASMQLLDTLTSDGYFCIFWTK